MINRIGRLAALIVAGAGAMAVSTACGTSETGVPSATGPGRVESSAPAGATSVTGAATTTTPPNLRFANKTLTAGLTGYDGKLDMVQFNLVRFVPGGADNGHYDADPADPATHRLPLAKSPMILSAISICSDGLTADAQGNANKTCTKDQLVQALNNSVFPYAALQVDGTDHIAKLSELYAP
jgi:hypothetical protein